MLFGAGATGIDGVQVEFPIVGHVARNKRALDEMDVVEMI